MDIFKWIFENQLFFLEDKLIRKEVFIPIVQNKKFLPTLIQYSIATL